MVPDWYSHPHWSLAIIFVAVGFYILIKGADYLVVAAVAMARKWGVSTAVIGATVVAFGTSLPELAVSLGSQVKFYFQGVEGAADIAVANIVGSNIFNIGCILGIAALIRPLPVPRSSVRLDYPLMVLALSAMILCSIPFAGGPPAIGRVAGIVLFCGLVAFTIASIRLGKVDTEEIPDEEHVPHGPLKTFGLLGLGILMLTAGGDISLTGATKIAETVGLSQRVIGLTVCAIGTSLPELATSLQAARRGETEIAVANVIGSNIFNVLCIIGLSATIVPLPVNPGTLWWDYWWMMLFVVLLLPFMLRGREIRRGEGIVLVLFLVTYVTLVVTIKEPSVAVAWTWFSG